MCDKGADCKFALCLRLHPQSHLERMLYSKAPPGLVNTFKTLTKARADHQTKILAAGQRYFQLSQDASGSADVCAERQQVCGALEREAAELRLQRDAFDSVVMREVDFYGISKPGVSNVMRSKFKHTMLREAYRLALALPALAMRGEIERSVDQNQFVIIQGATGSGKSTQIPPFVYELLRHRQVKQQAAGKPGARSKVICTQPRKVSAISLAERVAEEWCYGKTGSVGDVIGYRVGATRKTGIRTGVEYVTEGTFLGSLLKMFSEGGDASSGAERQDPLRGVGAIIIDEAHERSINCDVILGILRTHAPTRWPDLRVVVTSATLDTKLFSEYFSHAPVLEIPGRMFPVQIQYLPQGGGAGAGGGKAGTGGYMEAAVRVTCDIHQNTPSNSGDILCFLTGQDEVEKARDRFAALCAKTPGVGKTAALALYGKQSPEEQRLVFKTPTVGTRKVVFATDVAETGVTIDGVRHIVDTGLCKESNFDSKRNVTVLEVQSICQSSAVQRKGRAGRTAPGTCYRIYSQDDFDNMSTSKTAEVLARPLQLTAVSLIAMGIDPLSFAWPESPNKDALAAAMQELEYLGALTRSTKASCGYTITEVGELVALLQIDPGVARMIYHSCRQGMGEAGCDMAALMSVSSNFFRRASAVQREQGLGGAMNESHAAFSSSLGDVVSMFDAYTQWEKMLMAYVPKAAATEEDSTAAADDALSMAVSELDLSFANEDPSLSADHTHDPDVVADLVAMGFSEAACVAALTAAMGSLEFARQILTGEATGVTKNDADVGDGGGKDAGNEDDTNLFAYAMGSLEFDRQILTGEATDVTKNDTDDVDADDESMSVTSDTSHSVSAAAAVDTVAQAEVASEKRVSRFAASAKARQWCNDNYLNGKSLGMAQSTKRDLVRSLKGFRGGALWKSRGQDTTPSPEAIQRLLVKALFLNSAVQMRNPIEYEVLRNNIPTVGRIHPGSCLQKKFNQEQTKLNEEQARTQRNLEAQRRFFPDFIVFGSLMTTSSTFLNVITPASPDWIREESEVFFDTVVSPQLQSLRSERVVFENFRQFMSRKILGKRGEKRRSIEEKFVCSVQYDVTSGLLEVWCTPTAKGAVEAFFKEQIERVQKMALEEVEEDVHMGETRVLFGPGALVERLLFKGEYVTINIRGLAPETTEADLQSLLERYGRLRCWDLAPGERSSCASATFWECSGAKRAFENLNGETVGGKILTVSASGAVAPGEAASERGENNQLVMSWATASSDGTAHITFSDAAAANSVVRLCNRGRNCPVLQALGPSDPGDGQRVGVHIRAMVPQQAAQAQPQFLFDERTAAGAAVGARSSKSKAQQYTLKVSGLYPHTDEVELEESISLLRQRHLQQLPHPKFVKVNRPATTGDSKAAATLDETALSVETAELTSSIPLMGHQEKLLSCTSFFDMDSKGVPRGRAGFYLQYSSADVIEEAMAAWRRLNAGIDAPTRRCGQPVRIVAKLSSSLKLHADLYAFYGRAFEEAMATARRLYGVVCKFQPPRDTRVVRPKNGKPIQPQASITVSADNHAALRAAMGVLSDVLQSEPYEPPDDTSKSVLFSFPGRAAMLALSRGNAYFHWDNSVRLVRVYGPSKEAIMATITKISKEVVRLKTLLGHEQSYMVAFKKRKYVLKAWYALPRGAGSIKSKILEFNVNGQTVTIKGSEEGLEMAQQWLLTSKFLATGKALAGPVLVSDGKICNLCTCEIDNPFYYRACGHGACLECAVNQLGQIDVSSNVSLPVVCFANESMDCGVKLALTDIVAITSDNAYSKIKEAAVMQYVRQHGHKVRLCPSPGCDQLLDLSVVNTPTDSDDEIRLGGTAAFCDQCCASYCLFCSDRDHKAVKTHAGCGCADSLPGGRDEVLVHFRHIAETILTLRCPYCAVAFFDWDGCCAVHCENCSEHFCGLCQDKQKNSSLSHHHVSTSCRLNPGGGYFANPTQIADAHRSTRVRKLREYIGTLPKGDVKRRVLAECAPMLEGIQISTTDLV